MTDSFDHVIVGAGSAGCVLANRLSANGATVAVIEAGGKDRHPYIHIPAGYARILDHAKLTWGFRTEPDAATGNRALDYPRGRVWGGSSSINGLGHVRGDPSDYDLWAQKGCTGWGWDDLLPYFMRHESFAGGGEGRGTTGPQPIEHLAERPELLDQFAAAAEAIGLPVNADMNGPRREGFATFQQTRRGQRRISAARAYLVPALSRPNLTVIDDSLALRIVVEEGRATGVLIRRGGEERLIRARFGSANIEISAYYNDFSNFIYQTPTGDLEDDLPVYAFASAGARQYGFEAEANVTLAELGAGKIVGDAVMDLVRVKIDGQGPAPFIPPFRVLGGLEYQSDPIIGRIEVERVAKQDRIAAFETVTPGYTMANARIEWRPKGPDGFLSLRLAANNIFDVEARRHSSFLADYAPLAGRDIRVGASIRF